MDSKELKDFLDTKADQYEQPQFVRDDPIQIPRMFQLRQDCEIAGLLSATISWGNRKSILKSGHRMMELMDGSPYDFVINHSKSDLKPLTGFVHRTFNGVDLITFIHCLKRMYVQYGNLEAALLANLKGDSLQTAIHRFKQDFFYEHPGTRTLKHLGDPAKGSAAKRTNMFLRWMVRPADKGVDLGLWKNISSAHLSCPLDVHSGRVARKLGLLDRKQNDAKAVIELDHSLRELDAMDPVRYDFALFGLGVFEKF
ncbi:TIGR02757 family protein [Aureitalea marina]|uniref:TIGR02757 family protein n=1 Tax=Aureitalea marina TaxID=930804 RepID=A0A2S7KPD0_9FLAO|nr:TIGR02757 family protein [Aureitalea marina]PQB04486.1 TIGR02757 family protein [Aureitalea marina]